MARGGGKHRWRYILPGLYLAFALYVWIDFTQIARDGLANVGLFLATLPVALVGGVLTWLAGSSRFILLPPDPGYLAAHAIYYVPAVTLAALLLWWLGRAIDRRLG